ncbi:MAG TPA: hypothetical protein VFT72_15025 [Opitutaceae bacterium]|nr:hypothetical protein [Opitutaceae bacterium]
MKFAAFLGALVALTTSVSAQVVTIHSSVIGTDGLLFSTDLIGGEVTETYRLGSSTLRQIAPNFDLIEYVAQRRLEIDGLGLIFDWSPTLFDIQDVSFGYGFIAGASNGSKSSTELWSSNPSVLTNQFLTTPVKIDLFDGITTGGYFVNAESGGQLESGYVFWKVTAVDVTSSTPVPEPSTYAFAASALLCAVCVGRRKFKTQSDGNTKQLAG